MNFVLPLLTSADVPSAYTTGTIVTPTFSIDVSADASLPAQALHLWLQFDHSSKTVFLVDANFPASPLESQLASAGIRAAVRLAYEEKVTATLGKPVKVQVPGWTDASLVAELRTQMASVAPNVLTEMYWQYPEGYFVVGDSLTLYWSVPFAAGTATNPRTATYDPRFTVSRPTLQTPAVDVVVALRVVAT